MTGLPDWSPPTDEAIDLAERLLLDVPLAEYGSIVFAQSVIPDHGPCLVALASRETDPPTHGAAAITLATLAAQGEVALLSLLEYLAFRINTDHLHPVRGSEPPPMLQVRDGDQTWVMIEGTVG